MKRRAARAGAPARPARRPARPSRRVKRTRPPLTSVFSALNTPGFTAGLSTPSDSTGAIGPTHYMELVNTRVGVYSRADLSLVSQADLDTFVGKPGDDVFDPQVIWDQQTGRWYYLAADVDPGGENSPDSNFLAFGWSRTADPSDLGPTGWCRFRISTDTDGNLFDDYPKLGDNDNHIIFGTNVFDLYDNFFARIWAVPKPANGDTTCTPPPAFPFGSLSNPLRTADGDLAFTPVPANTTDSSANGYVVAAEDPYSVFKTKEIMAWHVSGPAGAPTLTGDGNMRVGRFRVPDNVAQPGSFGYVDSLDTRLTQAVARADPDAGGQEAVWTQHTIRRRGVSAVRWYELLPASLKVRQKGKVKVRKASVFNGAISPASNGTDAVVVYNVGGSRQLVDIRARSREGTTRRNRMGDEIVLASSTVAYQDFTCDFFFPCRWGDYAAATPDPNESRVVWGSSQVSGPLRPVADDPHWATQNFALMPAPRP